MSNLNERFEIHEFSEWYKLFIMNSDAAAIGERLATFAAGHFETLEDLIDFLSDSLDISEESVLIYCHQDALPPLLQEKRASLIFKQGGCIPFAKEDFDGCDCMDIQLSASGDIRVTFLLDFTCDFRKLGVEFEVANSLEVIVRDENIDKFDVFVVVNEDKAPGCLEGIETVKGDLAGMDTLVRYIPDEEERGVIKGIIKKELAENRDCVASRVFEALGCAM